MNENIIRRTTALVASATLLATVALTVAVPVAAGNTECVGNVWGGSLHNVTVPQGEQCNLHWATVNGNIQVQKGAKLQLESGNEVMGNIEVAQNGVLDLMLWGCALSHGCDSYETNVIHGNVHLGQGASLFTKDWGWTAAKHTIDGNVQGVKIAEVYAHRISFGRNVEFKGGGSLYVTRSDMGHNVHLGKLAYVNLPTNVVGKNLKVMDIDTCSVASNVVDGKSDIQPGC